MRKFKRRRHDLDRAVPRPRLPRDPRPRRRPNRLRSHHRVRRLTSPVRTGSAPDANSVPIPRTDADRPSARPPASAAAPAWPPARTPAPCSSSPPRPPTSTPCPRASPRSDKRVLVHGAPHGRGGLRQLHQPVRVRSRLPQRDPRRLHRRAQPRLRQGQRGGKR